MANFCSPNANIDIKPFVVTIIRNSLIESVSSDNYKLAGFQHQLEEDEIKKITSSAINFFKKFNFEEACNNLRNKPINNYYLKVIKKYPLSWNVVYKTANLKSLELYFNQISIVKGNWYPCYHHSIEVNIDYILGLVKKYHDSNMQDKEVLVTINKAIMASPDLRNKKDLILAFINSLDANSDVYSDFESFMNSKKTEELDKIIEEENLNKDQTYNFVRKSFEQGKIDTNGTEISDILPPMSMFSKDNNRQKNKLIDKILEFFDKFFSLSNDKF